MREEWWDRQSHNRLIHRCIAACDSWHPSYSTATTRSDQIQIMIENILTLFESMPTARGQTLYKRDKKERRGERRGCMLGKRPDVASTMISYYSKSKTISGHLLYLLLMGSILCTKKTGGSSVSSFRFCRSVSLFCLALNGKECTIREWSCFWQKEAHVWVACFIDRWGFASREILFA